MCSVRALRHNLVLNRPEGSVPVLFPSVGRRIIGFKHPRGPLDMRHWRGKCAFCRVVFWLPRMKTGNVELNHVNMSKGLRVRSDESFPSFWFGKSVICTEQLHVIWSPVRLRQLEPHLWFLTSFYKHVVDETCLFFFRESKFCYLFLLKNIVLWNCHLWIFLSKILQNNIQIKY